MLDPTILEQLRQADSPTVANVIELFGIRSRATGFANGSLKAIYPDLPPAVGFAVTATFRSAYPAQVDSYVDMPALIQQSAESPEPRIVVFQDLDDPPQAATYGEVMATAFKTFGFAGIITTGAARDIDQVRVLNLPCWATSVIVSHGYCHIPEIQVPVIVGGLRIHPGDLLHADCNGIVQIPIDIAPQVARLCAPFMDAERIVLDYLRSPDATPQGYADATRQMKETLGRLVIGANPSPLTPHP